MAPAPLGPHLQSSGQQQFPEAPGGCHGPSEAGPAGQAAPALAGPPDLWPALLLTFPPGCCRHGAVLAATLKSCSPLVSQTSVRRFLLPCLPYKCFICKLDPHNNSTRWGVLLSVYRWGNRGTELVRRSWDLPASRRPGTLSGELASRLLLHCLSGLLS